VFALEPGETVVLKYAEFAEPPANAVRCDDSSVRKKKTRTTS
jgi:hypothetical protein